MSRSNILSRSILLLVLVVLLFFGGARDSARSAPPPPQARLRWLISPLYSEGFGGLNPALAAGSDGSMAVSFYDQGYLSLRLLVYPPQGLANCGLINSWECYLIETGTNTGIYSSVDIFPGSGSQPWKLGVAYYDGDSQSLDFMLFTCDDSGCSDRYTPVASGSMLVSKGFYPSLKFDSKGVPHISYGVRGPLVGSKSLYHAYPVDLNGNCGYNEWYCELVTGSSSLDMHSSLALDGGDNLHIAFYDSASGLNYYSKSGDVWAGRVIDAQGGFSPSLAIADYNPRIAYSDNLGGKLKYATFVGAGDPIANCGPGASLDFEWNCAVIAEKGTWSESAFGFLSLGTLPLQKPVIAYGDGSDELAPIVLRIARPISVLGLANGNCGPMIAGLHTWQCDLLDSGENAYLDVGRRLSLAVDSKGLVSVAFTKEDSYYDDLDLMIARQRWPYFLPLLFR